MALKFDTVLAVVRYMSAQNFIKLSAAVREFKKQTKNLAMMLKTKLSALPQTVTKQHEA